MTDVEFLNWIADQLVNRYGENPNIDFMLKLRDFASEYSKSGDAPAGTTPDADTLDRDRQ